MFAIIPPTFAAARTTYSGHTILANLSNEDLAYYANLQENNSFRWASDKVFKVSNSVGTMAIPVALSTLSGALGPVGGVPVSSLSNALSITASAASYTTMFMSSLGRNRESLMQAGETNNALIWTNALLHASMETFGEMALGKILKPTKVTEFLKQTTAKNHPVLGALFNASDNLEAYLLKNNCNARLAKYLSNMAGEVLQENLENIVGYGIDAVTYGAIKGEVKLPTVDEMLQEAWETTWTTALTTTILNGFTDFTMSNVTRKVNIMGVDVDVSLNDILAFTDEETNLLDYTALSKHLVKNGRMSNSVFEAGVANAVQNMYTLSGGNPQIFIEMIQELPDDSSVSKFFKNMTKLYKQGNDNAVELYNDFFKNFRDHGFAHAVNVAAYAGSLGSGLDINLDETLYAALSHDYGMKGGDIYIDEKGSTTIMYKLLQYNGYDFNGKKAKNFSYEEMCDLVKKQFGEVDGSNIIEQYQPKKVVEIESMRYFLNEDDTLDNFTRANHPLNSAITVLTEGYLPEGVDPDVVALIAMTHSKSTSGIKHFSDPDEWIEAIDKLSATLDQYNKDNGTNYEIDVDKLKDIVKNKPDEFKRLQNEALVVRDGDAFAPVVQEGDEILMQDGTTAHVSDKLLGDEYVIKDKKTGKIIEEGIATARKTGDYNKPVDSLEAEVETFNDTGHTQDGDNRDISGDVSKRIHSGEGNVVWGNNSTFDGKNYKAKVELVDPNKYPQSTFIAIAERILEVNTYTNADTREFEIVLPKDAKGTALGDWYEGRLNEFVWDSIKNHDGDALDKRLFETTTTEFGKNDINQEIYDKQMEFYKNIKIVYE